MHFFPLLAFSIACLHNPLWNFVFFSLSLSHSHIHNKPHSTERSHKSRLKTNLANAVSRVLSLWFFFSVNKTIFGEWAWTRKREGVIERVYPCWQSRDKIRVFTTLAMLSDWLVQESSNDKFFYHSFTTVIDSLLHF